MGLGGDSGRVCDRAGERFATLVADPPYHEAGASQHAHASAHHCVLRRPPWPDHHAGPPLQPVRHRHRHYQGLRGLLLDRRRREGRRDGRAGGALGAGCATGPLVREHARSNHTGRPAHCHQRPLKLPHARRAAAAPNRCCSTRRSARSCPRRCATGRRLWTAATPSTTSWSCCRCSRWGVCVDVGHASGRAVLGVAARQERSRRRPPALTAARAPGLLAPQALASPAMRERHWRAVMAITGKDLVLAEDVFKLQHLLECNLLQHRRAAAWGVAGRGGAGVALQLHMQPCAHAHASLRTPADHAGRPQGRGGGGGQQRRQGGADRDAPREHRERLGRLQPGGRRACAPPPLAPCAAPCNRCGLPRAWPPLAGCCAACERAPHPAAPPPPQTFADYKTRGPVVLKPSDTAELIEKLEDSQMQLGSMATNRWARGAACMPAPRWLGAPRPA